MYTPPPGDVAVRTWEYAGSTLTWTAPGSAVQLASAGVAARDSGAAARKVIQTIERNLKRTVMAPPQGAGRPWEGGLSVLNAGGRGTERSFFALRPRPLRLHVHRARLAEPVVRGETGELHVGRQVAVAHGLLAHQVGGEVLGAAVREHGRHHGARAQLALHHQRADEVGARGDPDREAERGGELLRHEDRVAVRDRDHVIELLEPHDLGDELVGDALDAVMPHAPPGRERGRLGGLERVDAHAGLHALQVAAHAHHRAAGADAGHERVELELVRAQLHPDLGAG